MRRRPHAEVKDKVSIFKKIGKFFRECRSELKKIVWYNREQTFRSSVLVIVCIIIVGVVVAALDFAFSRGLIWLGNLI